MTGSRGQPISILFVCMGNICRSPTAEGVMRNLVEATDLSFDVIIDSAGTYAYHVGEPPDPRAVNAALRRGVDISGQAARAVDQADFEKFDLILAMDADNLADLESKRPEGSHAELELLLNYGSGERGSSVPDPYYGGSSGFERVLDMLDDASHGLLEHLRRRQE